MDAVQVEGGKPTNGEQNEAASSEEAQDRWNLIPINSPMSWPEKDVDSWGFVRKQFSLGGTNLSRAAARPIGNWLRLANQNALMTG